MDVASGGRTAAKDDAYEIRRMIAIRQTISRLPAAALAPRMLLLLDQVAFSLTNFVLTIVIARTYSAAEFGAYGVGLASALAIQFAQRSLYIIGLSLMSERVARRRLGGIVAEHILFTGATILVLAIGAAGAVIAGIGRAGIEIAAATMVCAVVYFQADFDRAVLVKRGAYAGAFGLSVVYLLIVGVLAVLAKFAHLGFFRDPATLEAVPYYANLPEALAGVEVFVLDPMLATGHSALAALGVLTARGADTIAFVCAIAASDGVAAVRQAYPNVRIVTAAVDAHLNEHAYIVPGLGDAGDRLYGTAGSLPTSYRRAPSA